MADDDFEIRAVLFERIVRSLAHSVGNATNVVSGRLSLIEMNGGLSPEVNQSVERTRARLQELQNDLHRALLFGSLRDESFAGRCVIEQVQEIAREQGVAVELGPGCEAGRGPNASISPALRRLSEATRLAGAETTWMLRCGIDEPRDIALRLALPGDFVPPDRRALLEPWFSTEELEAAPRYRRLVLAEALGLLESSSAKLTFTRNDGERAQTVVEAIWSHG